MSEERIQGLTAQQVEESRRKYGENVLTPPARESLWKKFLEKFEDPIIRILLIAWGLSMVISCVHCWGPEKAGFSAFLEPIGIFFAIPHITFTNTNCCTLFFTYHLWQYSQIQRMDDAITT